MMDTQLPKWFEVERTFRCGKGWYIGTLAGINLGPYKYQETAKQRSKEISNELSKIASPAKRIVLIRQLLHDEWDASNPSLKPSGSCSPGDARKGERHRPWFRSSRFFKMDQAWFFSTREGIDVGPYDSMKHARRDERRLVKLLAEATNSAKATMLIHEFKHRPSCGLAA